MDAIQTSPDGKGLFVPNMFFLMAPFPPTIKQDSNFRITIAIIYVRPQLFLDFMRLFYMYLLKKIK